MTRQTGAWNRLSSYKTKVIEADGEVLVQYHDTVIVHRKPRDKEILLDTGGYKTVTTKRKMNQAANQFGMPYDVFQKDWNWYVTWQGKTIPFDGDCAVLSWD
jgi:hypothetical protein